MADRSKFTYPKCPYCKKEYRENVFDGNYALLHLATEGWCKEEVVKCKECGEKFKVTVHISYYGSKIKQKGGPQ